MSKNKTSKNYSVGKGMSVIRRDDRNKEYWGYLRINGKTYRKSMNNPAACGGVVPDFDGLPLLNRWQPNE